MSDERLARIEALLERLTARVEEHIAKTDETDRTVRSGERSLLVRIDRLEQSGERQRWLVRSVIAAVVVLAVRAVSGLMD